MGERRWTRQDSIDTYLVDKWGAPYFGVNSAGNLAYAPQGAQGPQVDLRQLIADLVQQGVAAPLLIRFDDILRARIDALNGCFSAAIAAQGYRGRYRGVMPIKVNQQRHVVEKLVAHGTAVGLGLEAGSKPELLVALALLQGDDALLVCNGYKDNEYIETALGAQALGIRPYLVLDRFAELELIIDASRRTGIRPHIGVRAKLSCRGSGRWKDSSGDRSKFGLSASEMVRCIERLRDCQMLDCLELLHFHIGSQITAISAVKDALREAMHLYCHIREQGAVNFDTIDCGGGLAVDYDGSRTNFHSSKNYSTQEYASDVVHILGSIAAKRGHPHPHIISESGRALVAQHSVLLFNVLGVHAAGGVAADEEPAPLAPGEHEVVARMHRCYDSVNQRNFQEAYNDILEHKEEVATLFAHGLIDLQARARAEQLFWCTCRRIQRATSTADYVPDDLRRLGRELSDTYYCNFSIFQSLPDSWAVGHLFPIMPVHRLLEEPEREGVLADLTCDSDGKIDRFIDLRDVRDTLRLHAPNGEPYYLGAFLVGAYQEILGDLHNLFGDTNAVHVCLHADGTYTLDDQVAGDTVADVLRYVAYTPEGLTKSIRGQLDRAHARGDIDAAHAAAMLQRYAEGLRGYTYLEDFD